VKGSKPHKGVPDFISKEDLASKVGILKNAITNIINTEDVDNSHNKYYKTIGKFRRYVEDNVLYQKEECTFANKPVYEYLDEEDWVMLHTILQKYKAGLILLRAEAMRILNKLGNKLMINAAYASSRMWRVFVQECFKKHGGRMFKHISQEDKAYIPVTNDEANTYGVDPSHHLEMHASQWENRWHRAVDFINKAIHNLLMRILQLAKADRDIDNTLDVEKYDNSTKGYPKDTRGGDVWTCTDLKRLPIEGKKLMAEGMEMPPKKLAQPIQNLINLQAILGKPTGGTRTVCKTPMLYRMTLRGRGEVAEWESIMSAASEDFDMSGKGKSALVASAYRGLQAEIYKYTEEQVIGVFHDFEKFFDIVDLEVLMNKAIELQFPIIDLLVTMLQHMAPRVIQCDGFCSRAIITNTSILAGCKHSVALTRVLFLTGMQKICIDKPLVAT